MIALNPYTKRLTAKILNLCPEFTVTYRPDHITGIRLIDGVAQVRVTVADRSYVLPFDAVQFRAMVERYRLEAIAAVSTEQAWERRRRAIAVPQVIRLINSLVRYFAPRRRSFIHQVEKLKTMTDIIKAHHIFTRKLSKRLDFSEFAAIRRSCHNTDKFTSNLFFSYHYNKAKHVKVWVYKAIVSLKSLEFVTLTSGLPHATYEDALQDAIARVDALDAYLSTIISRVSCPVSLAPVYDCSNFYHGDQSGCFVNQEATDYRVIAWYRLNMAHLGNDEGTRLYNVLVERTRQYTIRINALWITLEVGFNSLSLRRDAAPSRLLYYVYGVSYGLKGDQFISLTGDIPF